MMMELTTQDTSVVSTAQPDGRVDNAEASDICSNNTYWLFDISLIELQMPRMITKAAAMGSCSIKGESAAEQLPYKAPQPGQ